VSVETFERNWLDGEKVRYNYDLEAVHHYHSEHTGSESPKQKFARSKDIPRGTEYIIEFRESIGGKGNSNYSTRLHVATCLALIRKSKETEE